MSITSQQRRRFSPEHSRATALEAARALLIESGPLAVTLKAVAGRIGRTHANLLHHFGSAAELQSALAEMISDRVTGSIAEAVKRARQGQSDAREIIDLTFDAFDREGAGALAAWMILSGNRDALNPILEALREMVRHLSRDHEHHQVPESTLWLVLAALGDSLLGEAIASALELPRDSARRIAATMLRNEIEAHHLPRRSD